MLALNTLPSFVEHRIDIPVRPNFIATNASVAIHRGEVFAAICCGDHFMDHTGHYMPVPPGAPLDRHRFSEQTVHLARFGRDLEIVAADEIALMPEDVPNLTGPTYVGFRGFDSARLFSWNDDLCMTMCAMGTGAKPEAALFQARIEGDPPRYGGLRRLVPILPFPTHAEKNWMPEVIGDQLRYHYHLGTLAAPDGTLWHPGGRADLMQLHGGSQVIPYEGGGICIAHGFHARPLTHLRRYVHYFVRINADGSPTEISEAFSLTGRPIEIVTGMAYHSNILMISYGRERANDAMPDQEFPFIATIALDDLRGILP